MNTSEKINRGCEVNYSGDYTAYAGWSYDNTSAAQVWTISYRKGEMPSFENEQFASEQELRAAMRKIAPLSHWRTVKD